MRINQCFLIIDDSYIDRIVTSSMVKTAFPSSEVTEAGGAIEGLQFLINKKHATPLIILLDIKMPEVNGFGFLEAFEKNNDIEKEGITIFMLSSTIDPTDVQQAEESTYVKKLLTKPLSLPELTATLSAL